MNENKKETENRLNELQNIMEKYTRTERHIEQCSDLISNDQMKHTEEVQNTRKENMDNIKNKIIYGDSIHQDQVENLKQNIQYTQMYYENNAGKIPPENQQFIEKKQENRREQLNNLK